MGCDNWYLEISATNTAGYVVTDVVQAATESGVYDLFRQWLRERTGDGFVMMKVWVRHGIS